MDESRKAFEEWIASTTNSDLHRGVMLDRRESGAYSHLATENKWEAWQASLASIEVELPSRINNVDLRAPLEVEDMWRERMKTTLRAAGIKVKE